MIMPARDAEENYCEVTSMAMECAAEDLEYEEE